MTAAPFTSLTLVIPAKPDSERDLVAAAWIAGGGAVLRLDRFWEPPSLDPSSVRLYGNDTFCLVVAQKLGLTLVSPPDDLLINASGLARRDVRTSTLTDALAGVFPCFVKPLVPKVFRAAVWRNPEDLSAECRGLEPSTPVILSEVVRFTAEARAFVLDGAVLGCAVYEGSGDVGEATSFLAGAARVLPLGRTCAVDAGFIEGRGWALLEANAAWGAGLNGCDAAAATACIAAATTRLTPSGERT